MNYKPWLKMWVKWLNEPDMVSLTLAESGAWWRLYTFTHNCDNGGKITTEHGRPLNLDEIQDNLRLKDSDLPYFITMVDKMLKEGMLYWDDETLVITHYQEDQTTAPSDTKEARAERQRKRRKTLLEEYGNKDNPVPLPVRLEVIERDKCCQHCGKIGARTTPTSAIVIDPADSTPFEFDHVIPRAKGGTDDPDNIVLSCRPCNRTRNSRPLSQESRDNSTPLKESNKERSIIEIEREGEGEVNSLQTCYKSKIKTEVCNKNDEVCNKPPRYKPVTNLIVDLYHDLCPSLPKVKELSDSRKKAIKTISQKHDDPLLYFRELFSKAEASDFLSGRRSSEGEHSNWRCNFDWLLNEKNRVKVLEGNYDNKGGPHNGRQSGGDEEGWPGFRAITD